MGTYERWEVVHDAMPAPEVFTFRTEAQARAEYEKSKFYDPASGWGVTLVHKVTSTEVLATTKPKSSWFREEHTRAKERNANIPEHAQMVVTNPAFSQAKEPDVSVSSQADRADPAIVDLLAALQQSVEKAKQARATTNSTLKEN